jgi:ribosomal protein S18 acetylase RimI-like enzyme
MIDWTAVKKAAEFTPEALADLDYYKDWETPEEKAEDEKTSKRNIKQYQEWYKDYTPKELLKRYAESEDYNDRLKRRLDELNYTISSHFPVDSTMDPALRIDNMSREKLLQNARRVLSWQRYVTKGATDVAVSPIYSNFDKYADHGVSDKDWKLLTDSFAEARKASPNIEGYGDEWEADEAITNGIPLRITAGGKDIGAASLHGGRSEIRIDELGLLPEHQGKGYGREALKQIARHILERRKSEWTYPWGLDYHKGIGIGADTANTRANHLYSSFGFKPVEKEDTYIKYHMPFDKARKITGVK